MGDLPSLERRDISHTSNQFPLVNLFNRYLFRYFFRSMPCAGAAPWLLACALASLPWPVLAADIDPALQRQADAVMLQALQQQWPALTRAQAQIHWMAPRGAALQPCAEGWATELPQLRRLQRVTLALRCGAARGSLVARVQVQQPAWTARRDLPAGHTLQPQDLEHKPQWTDSLEPPPEDWAPHGAQVRKALAAGSVLHERDLDRPVLLRRGDKVEIRASGDGVTVSTQGLALGAASLGQRVSVRNVRSQQVIEGVVVAPGVVQAGARKAGGVRVLPESSD